MKKLFLIVFLLPTILFCQIQVSDINFELPRDDYFRKGFMKVGEEEYFIEQGAEGTKVSKVVNNNLEFLHDLRYRPTDSQLNSYSYSYENSNSGLIYDGSILYETYWGYIYMVDVVSGELLEVIDLAPYGIRLQTAFHYGDNFFYFAALGDDENGFVRLDRNTGLLEHLENVGTIVGTKRYAVSANSSKIMYHDLETNQTSEYPYSFTNIEFIEPHKSDSNTKLIIKDDNGFHLLRSDDAIQTINCDIPNNSEMKYISDDRLAYASNNGTELVFTVIDLENCTEVYDQQFPDNTGSLYLPTYSDEQLFNEYFIFGFPNDWQGNGLFYLYDFTTDNAVQIDIPIDYPILDRAVRHDNSLYFLSSNHIHYIGDLPELYRLDLDSKQTERISYQDIFTTNYIVIGEPLGNQKLNVYYRTDETASLRQIDHPQQSLQITEEFDLYRNIGLYYSIYADIWVDNKYIFSNAEAIYVMENDVTTKLLDIGPNSHGSSAYKRKGDFVYVLTGLDDGHYALKIDINDLSYDKIFLPDVEYLYYKRATSENAIVNLSHGISYASSLGFFDLDSEEFVSFKDLGLPTGTPKSLSRNNIIYKTSSSNSNNWYLINTITREVILTEIGMGNHPDPYPDGNGGFYLDDWSPEDNVSFMHVNAQGELTSIYENFDHHVFYGGEKFDGKVKSLAFDGPEEIIFISTLEGEVRMKTIPDNGQLYYQRFFWYESDNISFVEVYDGDAYNTYTFTFDSDPENISPAGRDDRLVMVLEDESFAILVYKNDQNILSFEKYDYASGTIEQVNEQPSVRNSPVGSTSIKIDDSKHLISINDAIHGMEPWIFDMKNGELSLLKDIYQGHISSTVNDFTKNIQSDEIYFSAIKTEGDRQLFKLDSALFTEQEINMLSDLHIYPIPTNNNIHLSSDFEDVKIIGIDGRLISNLGSYKKGASISVENLNDGLYVLQARLENKTVEIGKFIVQK